MKLRAVVRRLAQGYGVPAARPQREPATELVYTILSQNTSDVNSKRAFEALMRAFGSLETLGTAEADAIAGAIWMGGLARVKAPRIREVLAGIMKERGSLDLSFLRDIPIPEAKAWLRSLPGVGPKTAACVLLFSLCLPVLPVDTHVHRVARRLALIGHRTSAEQAHETLEAMLPPEDVYSFHVNMVRHGREVCHAQRPYCAGCVVRDLCPSARWQLASGGTRVYYE
ncbi:MAG: endonuclease III [Chloroflexi bacterium]|nr:endonuclease III [Chloroflexota bacterium]